MELKPLKQFGQWRLKIIKGFLSEDMDAKKFMTISEQV
jgi:hypothetical protein